MPPPPLTTWFSIAGRSGLRSSRFGPTVPCELAAASVWQAPQPAVTKIRLPSSALPFGSDGPAVVVVGFGSVPTTVSATGCTTVPPQPASTSRSGIPSRRRRILGDSNQPTRRPAGRIEPTPYVLEESDLHETQGIRTRRRIVPPHAVRRRLARPALRRLRRHPVPGPERRARPDA